MVMGRHSGKVRGLGIISVILIVVVSYTVFFYLQNTRENNIKNRLFDQQKQTQFKSTKALSEHISSDLDSVMTSLQGLANSAYLQNGLLSDRKTIRYLEDSYAQINTITDKLFVLDKTNTAKINLVTKGQQNFIGTDMSFIEWVRETQTEHKPAFSNGFVGLDGKYRIALAYPIINIETGEHFGLIGAVIPTEDSLPIMGIFMTSTPSFWWSLIQMQHYWRSVRARLWLERTFLEITHKILSITIRF